MRMLPNPQKIFWQICVFASFLLGQSAQALELGTVLSRSDAQQALNISMQVRLAANEQLSQLRCQIASPDQFSSFSLSKPSFADDIQCSLQAGKTSQTAILTLQSAQVMPQPIVHLVLAISHGELATQLLQFTVLLEAPALTQLPSVASKSADIEALAVAPVSEQAASQSYQVLADETLMNVARQFGIAEASMNQFMLAVLQRNPQAFIRGNMHLLKQGSVLQIPSPAEWQAIDAETARQQVQAQGELSREYRQLSTSQDNATQDKASPAVSENSPVNPAPNTPADSRDIVKLSNAAGANSRVQGLTVQEEINALRDELAAHEVSIREANQKTAELEKQIQQMQNLLLMREKALAQIELQRPWWEKLNAWLAQHAWAVLLIILALLLALVLAIQRLSKRRAEKLLQAMMLEVQAKQPVDKVSQADNSQPAANQPSDMPSLQTALDVQAVLQKTAQILQGIDLSLSDSQSQPAQPNPSKPSASIDTQFDLVASYIDMGELAKAEQLLQQIIQQGDAKQQARAKRLLNKISS